MHYTIAKSNGKPELKDYFFTNLFLNEGDMA
jgi:hypothetical protein